MASWLGWVGSLGLSTRAEECTGPSGLAWPCQGTLEAGALVDSAGSQHPKCHLYIFFTHVPDITGPGNTVPSALFTWESGVSEIKHLDD